jgi:hypothetical protein
MAYKEGKYRKLRSTYVFISGHEDASVVITVGFAWVGRRLIQCCMAHRGRPLEGSLTMLHTWINLAQGTYSCKHTDRAILLRRVLPLASQAENGQAVASDAMPHLVIVANRNASNVSVCGLYFYLPNTPARISPITQGVPPSSLSILFERYLCVSLVT